MLNRLSNATDKNRTGFNRNEGLAVINKTNGPKFDKEERLFITIETNLIETEFQMISSTL